MKALIVYESLWGNTAEIARAIADAIGIEARAVSTAEATGEVLAGVDLIVAGAPVLAFSLPTEAIRESIRIDPKTPPSPPNLSHPSMRTWLGGLPKGSGHGAAFETRIWWSPGGSIGAISRGLKRAGYPPLMKGKRFIVTGKYGPLREGEKERARSWGRWLAEAIG